MRFPSRPLALGAIVALLGLAALGLLRRLEAPTAPIVVARAAQPVQAGPRSEARPAQPSPVATARDAARQAPAPAVIEDERAALEEPPVRAPEPGQLGLVVDLDGAPIAGVGIRNRSDPRSTIVTRSDDLGVFDLTDTPQAAREEWIVAGNVWTTVVPAARLRARDEAMRIVASPAIEVAGFVENERREPLAGVHVVVRAELDSARLGGVHPIPPTPQMRVFQAQTNASGRFSVREVPALAGLSLSITASGHAAWLEPITAANRSTIRVTLRELGNKQLVRGVVLLDSGGAPAGGAMVSLGQSRVKTGQDGSFELALGSAPADAWLVASYRGKFPAVLEPALRPPNVPFESPLRLVLPGMPQRISGQVLASDGEPLEGWSVGILDGTPDGLGLFIEQRAGLRSAKTDADGHFQLSGLGPRPYRLWAADGQGAVIRSGPVAAGTQDCELRVAP